MAPVTHCEPKCNVGECIDAWESDGYSNPPSEDFFHKMLGFMWTWEVPEDRFPMRLAELLEHTGVCDSKADAKRAIGEGAITLNNKRIESPRFVVAVTCDAAYGKWLMLGRGKSRRGLVLVDRRSACSDET